jgi:hypothetical protein
MFRGSAMSVCVWTEKDAVIRLLSSSVPATSASIHAVLNQLDNQEAATALQFVYKVGQRSLFNIKQQSWFGCSL